MTPLRPPIFTSLCKGEVGREADGRGSAPRFSRTRKMTSKARSLRATMTDAELKLWNALRRTQLNGFHFRRQHPLGRYVLDFYCPSLKLCVEIDGGQHATNEHFARDARRSLWLSENGIEVVRFWNNDVLRNLSGVLETIRHRCEARTPSPTLPLSGGGRAGDLP